RGRGGETETELGEDTQTGRHQDSATHSTLAPSPPLPLSASSLHGFSRIMIRVPNWVGDAVIALPALRELRRIFAGARITLVARPWVAGLFDGEGLADELMPIRDARNLIQASVNFASDVRTMRQARIDL